jgi:hypothetical protein
MHESIRLTSRERDWLFSERVRAIRDHPQARLSPNGRYVMGPVRIRGVLYVTRRDRDGWLLATVRVGIGRERSSSRYVRDLRCPPDGGARLIKLQRRPLTRVR